MQNGDFHKNKNKENLVANAQQVGTAIKPNTSSNALNFALNF